MQYQFEYSDAAGSVKASIRARASSSRRGYNGVRGSFGMQLIPPKSSNLKSLFCVCANNWTCHYCTGQRVNLVSSFGTRCPTAQVRVFKDSLHPELQQLRATSPDRSISRTNKFLPFQCVLLFNWFGLRLCYFDVCNREDSRPESKIQFEEIEDST